MTLGERIKRIRTFRGLTQRELGLKLGYEERNADVRVAQYESGYRVPKKDSLMEIANASSGVSAVVISCCARMVLFVKISAFDSNSPLSLIFSKEHIKK